MTIGNALAFIKRGQNDDAFRKRLNIAPATDELERILAEEKLMFSLEEFDEAFHLRLVQCQEEQSADQLKEFKLWWVLLFQMSQVAKYHRESPKHNFDS